jgi:hypothetical protein
VCDLQPNLVLKPALMVGVTSVAGCTGRGRVRGLPVAVKATRHQTARLGHGAVLISTRRMSGVEVDAEDQTVGIECLTRPRLRSVKCRSTAPLGYCCNNCKAARSS